EPKAARKPKAESREPKAESREPKAESLLAAPWPLVQDHPVDAESIPHLAESRGEERLLHRHEHLPAIRERRKDALGLTVAVDQQRQVRTPHRFGSRDVCAHPLGAGDGQPRV